jgi:hypothetical protein
MILLKHLFISLNLMKRRAFVFFLLILVSPFSFGENEDFLASFRGLEKTSVSNCPDQKYNKTFTLQWNVTHTKALGDTFEGIGSNFNGGFKMSGKISGNKTTGSIESEGVNIWGYPWNGTFEGTLEGNKYILRTKGKYRPWCTFSSEVESTKE